MRKHIIVFLPALAFCSTSALAVPSVASTEYVISIVNALGVPEINKELTGHIANMENPHGVTAEQVGLGNVKNIDTTNAENITDGVMNIAQLPVGSSVETVASGADNRFDTLPVAEPAGTPPDGRVYVWFN
ncbi:MAG: hypothetical protein K2I81_00355 [Alphaproteobacteria bacterium]|nr:hypothetical protein [Alphaproteobacteria bacterium]